MHGLVMRNDTPSEPARTIDQSDYQQKISARWVPFSAPPRTLEPQRNVNRDMMFTDNKTSISPQVDNTEQNLTRHTVYYFDPVVFRVEGVIFKVPKYGFMIPGSAFNDMFSLPIPEGGQAEGSEENPIELPSGITQQDFFGFLFIMYPFLGRAACEEINYEELVGALKLATMWQFPKIRSHAIHLLWPLFKERHPVEILLLAREYRSRNILRWVYTALVDQSITIQYLRSPCELDWETISRIFAAKTHLTEQSLQSRDPLCPSEPSKPKTDPVEDCIDMMFEEDLERMEQERDVDVGEIKQNLGFYLSRRSQELTDTDRTGKQLISPQESQDSSNSGVNRRHHVYYIETILIPVEGPLFRLPKADLEHVINRIPPETSSQSFSRFLTAFYPHVDGQELLDYDEWLDVLHLSALWSFNEMRKKAITMLTPLIKERNPVEAVITARKYKVRAWLLSALEELSSQRPRPTMVQDLREPFALDWQTIAKILSIRCLSQSEDVITSLLDRPNACCSICRKTKSTGKYPCKFSCQTLALPRVSDDGKTLPGCLNNKEIQDNIRTMVMNVFGDEIVGWESEQ